MKDRDHHDIFGWSNEKATKSMFEEQSSKKKPISTHPANQTSGNVVSWN
jgi:hypothetical protein